VIGPDTIPSSARPDRSERSVWVNVSSKIDPKVGLNQADGIVTRFSWRRNDAQDVRHEAKRDGSVAMVTTYHRSFEFSQTVVKKFTETPDSVVDGEGGTSRGVFYPDWGAWAVFALPAVSAFPSIGSGWGGLGYACDHKDTHYEMGVRLFSNTEERRVAVSGTGASAVFAIHYALPSVTAAVWKEQT
jgi:hypothetical protein